MRESRFVPACRCLVVLLFLFWSLPAAAQTASLVRDLKADVDFGTVDSGPRGLFAFRGKVFFLAFEASTGTELWVSDGSAAGTELLADACRTPSCPGEPKIVGGGARFVFWTVGDQLWRSDGTRAETRSVLPGLHVLSQPRETDFAFLDGVLYFEGCTSGQPFVCALWRTDGTDAGTRAVKEVVPDGGSRGIASLTPVAGRLILVTGDFSGGFKLWTSNGTPEGTQVVRQLPFLPHGMVGAGSRIFMIMPAPGDDEELWVSDGTAAGTRFLARFRPEESFRKIAWLKPIGGRVYFVVTDAANGGEIWRSDGTVQGTQQVTNFSFHSPFQGNLSIGQLVEIGGRLVFFATDGLGPPKLWSAATAGQPAVALAGVCADCSGIDFQWSLVAFGGRVLFRGFDAAHGLELWVTDGTAAGTLRLTDVCAGACDSLDSQPFGGGSAVYAGLHDRRNRFALWRSDGTPAATRPIALPDNAGLEAVTVGRRVFFPAHDRYGWELWSSDGTAAGSGLVTDIASGAAASAPSDLTPFGSGIAFLANSPDGRVWRSGGGAETTVAVDHGDSFISYFALAAVADKLFYAREPDGEIQEQVWVWDGAPGGPRQLTHFDFDQDTGLGAGGWIVHQGRLLFAVGKGPALEMWTSDGTEAGTGKVFTIPGSVRLESPLIPVGSELFFFAADPSLRAHPFLSDGTTAGTRPLSPLEFDFAPSSEAVRLGSTTFFTGSSRLWKSDGTAAGTVPVRPDVFGGPRGLTVFFNALYFLDTVPVDAGSPHWGLWRSDGTAAGTVLVKELEDAVGLTAAGGRLFMAADDGVHGTELWVSDGTAAGTVLVRDVLTGGEGSHPQSFREAAGKLFFAADDGVHGVELWVSDGTAAGTRLVQDIAPGAPSSRPERFTVAGHQLFFTADDGLTGREPWVLGLDAPPATCTPSPTGLCLNGGRFRVEAFWRDSTGKSGAGKAVALTPDTGYIWFFDAANVETLLKVLDGRGTNGHFWVFYGALSDVEYALTVTDVQNGSARRYFNPQGRFASAGDTHGFGPLGAFQQAATTLPEASPLRLVRETFDPKAATGTCVPAGARLCLNGGRFAVEVAWKDFSGHTGAGTAVPLTGDTGTFWFFDAANVEVVLKVLDGRAVNGKFWVYYGALSNVEYTLTVTDTMTGKVKTYQNPSGRFASAGDVTAF